MDGGTVNTDGIRHTLALYFTDARQVRDDLRSAATEAERCAAVNRSALLVAEAGNMVWMLLEKVDELERRIAALEKAQAE